MGRMRDFKRFMSFVGKEFNHILRDTRTLMVLLVMPVVMIVLFGFALSTEIKDVKVAVYDPSKDAATARIITQIDASEYFTVTARRFRTIRPISRWSSRTTSTTVRCMTETALYRS